MPALKGTQFFASEMRVGPRPEHSPETLEQYLAVFDGARAERSSARRPRPT